MITIRPFVPEDWEIFRDIRLQALRTNPTVYTGSYEESLARSPEEWRVMLAGDAGCVFGLFDKTKVIGLTGIFATRENPQNARLVMSFIQPDYRGRRLSELFYKARIDWAIQNTSLKQIVVSHREGNEPSKRAMLRHGFQSTGKQRIIWPDGQEDWEHMYVLDLVPLRS